MCPGQAKNSLPFDEGIVFPVTCNDFLGKLRLSLLCTA